MALIEEKEFGLVLELEKFYRILKLEKRKIKQNISILEHNLDILNKFIIKPISNRTANHMLGVYTSKIGKFYRKEYKDCHTYKNKLLDIKEDLSFLIEKLVAIKKNSKEIQIRKKRERKTLRHFLFEGNSDDCLKIEQMNDSL